MRDCCRGFGWYGLLGGCFLLSAVSAGAETPQAEIVIANRYPQQTGTSHAHLYLYRADGKLLRQLTKDDSGQDGNPIFAPDGETIVFTRVLPKEVVQWWSIEPRGGNLRLLDAAPEWYSQAKTSPHFASRRDGPPIVSEPGPDSVARRTYVSDDGKTKVKLRPAPDAEADAPEKWKVSLQTEEDGVEKEVGDLAGYSAGVLSLPKGESDQNEQVFWRNGAFHVAFCTTHLNSTDGNTVVAVDLRAKKLVPLSPNWACPFPLAGEAALLTLTEERYIPFGKGDHTANCLYVDRWDAGWKKIRYAREKAPAVCYGASMYRPGKNPAVIIIRNDDEF